MAGIPPTVRSPSDDEIREKGATHYLDLSDDEVADFAAMIEERIGAYERLDELSASSPQIDYTDRKSGYTPDSSEDPLNAFVTRCEVKGASDGPLDGYEIGLKDNINLAGVETTLGSKVMRGYVPNSDATIVTRLLDAGATITGKLNMEDMAHSGSGDISAHGPVANPYDDDYLSGGSSSGSAAAVGNGDVDVAIGGDQAGSIRIPASWSGIVGHKPTHGLVPYTGIAGLGRTFDHTGPMANSVKDCARVLNAIAGKDPDDPRQGAVKTDDYVDAVADTPNEVTIGVLEEGFGRAESEKGVDDAVRSLLDHLEDTGLRVETVSVPMHLDGTAIWSGIATEATAATVAGEGAGYFVDGHYDTQFMDAFARARRAQADDFPPTLKLSLILGEYMADHYGKHYYAKAQNLSQDLATAYDKALMDVDVLALPTTPQTAHERDDGDVSRTELVDRGMNMLANTCPFDITGHPALSMPAGLADGLPVGLMLVGGQFEDATVLRIAEELANRYDWEEF